MPRDTTSMKGRSLKTYLPSFSDGAGAPVRLHTPAGEILERSVTCKAVNLR
jgi:hypothetical protein